MPPVVNIAATSAWYFRMYTEYGTRYRRSWCGYRGWGTVMGSSVSGREVGVIVISRARRADEVSPNRFSDTPETGSNPTMIDLINWSE